MNDGVDGLSLCEIPIWFRADRQNLFGILTEPSGFSRGIGVILLNGGACTPSTSRNRLSVRLARRLATGGYHVLRFDYHGVGESTGTVVRYSLNRPFTGDLVGAAAELRRRGLTQFVFVGRCFGARTALSAVGQIRGLRGLACISMPLHDFSVRHEDGEKIIRPRFEPRTLLGVFDRRQGRWYLRVVYYAMRKWLRQPWPFSRNGDRGEVDWVSPAVETWLHRAEMDRVQMLFLYGTDEDHYKEFRQAQEGAVGPLLERARDRVHVSAVDGPVHDLTTLRVQLAIMTRIQEWIEGVVGR